MDSKHDPKPDDRDAERKQRKAPYTTPVLTKFGDVGKITQGNGPTHAADTTTLSLG
jgi:hypothetical protein